MWCELEDHTKYVRQAVYYAREIVMGYASGVDYPQGIKIILD